MFIEYKDLSPVFNLICGKTRTPFCAHLLQLGSKLFVDEQVDEEVGQVVDVEWETKVAANRFAKKNDVEDRCEWHDENHEQTETDFHCFHVARFSARVLTEIDSD